MRVTELVHPFVLEARQQLAPAQLERLIEPFVLQVLTERGGVDPHPGTVEANAFTCREHSVAPLGAERSADRPDRVPQARAGARVQHLRPETGGQVGSRVAAGVEREPGKQRSSTP